MQKIRTANQIQRRFVHSCSWRCGQQIEYLHTNSKAKRTNISPENVLVLLCVLSWFRITHKPDFLCREFKFIAQIRTLWGHSFISITINLFSAVFFHSVMRFKAKIEISQMENPNFSADQSNNNEFFESNWIERLENDWELRTLLGCQCDTVIELDTFDSIPFTISNWQCQTKFRIKTEEMQDFFENCLKFCLTLV